MSKTSLRNVLEMKNFNSPIINQIGSVACLSNYGQSVDINGYYIINLFTLKMEQTWLNF